MNNTFLFDCPKYTTYRTALHNRLQEANLDDTIFTVKMEFLFSSCKTIITLAKYIEISLNIMFELKFSFFKDFNSHCVFWLKSIDTCCMYCMYLKYVCSLYVSGSHFECYNL